MSIGGISPVYMYTQIVKDEQSYADKAEKGSAETQSGIAHFEQNASKLTSPTALLKDYKSLQVVLAAYGMGDYINDTAILKKLMTQDPTSSKSLSATSGNATWQAFAKAMSSWSSSPFTTSAVSSITDGYVESQFEKTQENETPGMGDALYYTREIGSVTSVTQLMSNKRLLDVVLTLNNIDLSQYGVLDYNQQLAMVTKMVNLKDFQNSKTVTRDAERYLALTQMSGSTASASSSSSNPLLALFDNSGQAASLTQIAASAFSFTV